MSSQVNQEALIANEFNKQYPYDDMNGWDRKLFKSGYQAATKASESEINSLKQRVAELEADLELLKPNPKCDMGCMLACNMKGNAITELQADNLRLREALEDLAEFSNNRERIDKLLSSTPEKSLAEHDNQIIQMCADKAEEMALYAGIDIAEAIRLLKVTP